ncbi:MAG: ISL3 family transposase [Bacilli bacterium]|nr:ISL3 family transposase [Bacilli bacterium]
MKEIEKILGLGNYKILNILERNDKNKIIKIIEIETKNKKQKCPICGEYTTSIHDRLKPIELKYLKLFEYDTKIIITKKRFICHKCNKKFTEVVDLNNKGKNISNKLEQKVLKDLLNYNLSIKYIALENKINSESVRKILKNAMSEYPKQIKNLPRVISFDEFKADTQYGKYAFVLNDPIHRKCLDILPERKKEYLIQYFTYCNNRHSVEFVISDMYEPYLLVTQIMFPKAKYVVDRFHYTRYIMEALDKVRIRLQKEYGYNSKEYRMLKNKKNVTLLRKYSNDIDWWTYTQRYKNKHMVNILKYELREEILSINPELKQAYILKELFFDTVKHLEYLDAEEELKEWISICDKCGIKEFEEAAKTIKNWLPYIVNSFIDERFSNGYTEGLNNKIKVIKRIGFGYRNFDFFRLRIMYILNGKIIGISKKDRNVKK